MTTLQVKSNIFEILNLRSQWEELASNLNVDANSSIALNLDGMKL